MENNKIEEIHKKIGQRKVGLVVLENENFVATLPVRDVRSILFAKQVLRYPMRPLL